MQRSQLPESEQPPPLSASPTLAERGRNLPKYRSPVRLELVTLLLSP